MKHFSHHLHGAYLHPAHHLLFIGVLVLAVCVAGSMLLTAACDAHTQRSRAVSFNYADQGGVLGGGGFMLTLMFVGGIIVWGAFGHAMGLNVGHLIATGIGHAAKPQ